MDLLVSTHPRDELGAEENRLVAAAVPVARLQSKGRSLLRVDLSFGGAGGAFERAGSQEDVQRRQEEAVAVLPATAGKNTFTVRFVPLDASLAELAEVQALVAASDRDVAALNLGWARLHGEDCPPAKEAGQHVARVRRFPRDQ